MTEAVLTVGHSALPFDEFVQLLRAGGATAIVDVRTLAGSRRNPQFNEEHLRDELPAHDIAYHRIEQLGGLRKRQHDIDPSVNGHWQNRSFHNYADYALTPEFESGLDQLLQLAEHERVAIMCAEAVWWRCHRRIIADHLIARAFEVQHLMPGGKLVAATLTPGAVAVDDRVTYPAAVR